MARSIPLQNPTGPHVIVIPTVWETHKNRLILAEHLFTPWHMCFFAALQPGTPTGVCTETKTGVFERAWTAGKAVLDCNTWAAQLPFPSL